MQANNKHAHRKTGSTCVSTLPLHNGTMVVGSIYWAANRTFLSIQVFMWIITEKITMLDNQVRQKTFVRKTKRGKIIKIVREHYLRDDVWCGSVLCTECPQTPADIVLQANSSLKSSICQYPHYIIPDTNVVLHQVENTHTYAIVLERSLLCLSKEKGPPKLLKVETCLWYNHNSRNL